MMKQAAQEFGKGGGSDFFQFKTSGTFRFRVLSAVAPIATHFFGKGNPSSVCYGEAKGCPFHSAEHDDPAVKFITYILDREDDKVKLAELPWSVVAELNKYQKDDELAFTDYPMPYDIKVTVNKQSKDPKGVYSVLPGQARTALSAKNTDELAAAIGRMTAAAFVEKRKESTMEKHKEAGTWVDEETRAQKAEELRSRMAEGAAAAPAEDYPEGPNPDDIPF